MIVKAKEREEIYFQAIKVGQVFREYGEEKYAKYSKAADAEVNTTANYIKGYNRAADRMNNGLIDKYNSEYDKKLGKKEYDGDEYNEKDILTAWLSKFDVDEKEYKNWDEKNGMRAAAPPVPAWVQCGGRTDGRHWVRRRKSGQADDPEEERGRVRADGGTARVLRAGRRCAEKGAGRSQDESGVGGSRMASAAGHVCLGRHQDAQVRHPLPDLA